MLALGQVIYGFAHGYFGRDSYGPRRVEAVGVDWVVCRDESGEPEFAADKQIHEVLADCLTEKTEGTY